MSIHKQEFHFKTTKPNSTVKLKPYGELEKSAKQVYETIIKPPVSKTLTYITVIKTDVDAVKSATPRKTVLNFDLLAANIVETVTLADTNNLKEKLAELETKEETKGRLKFIFSDGVFGAYMPLNEEQLKNIKRDVISEVNLNTILEYRGVIMTFNLEALEQILEYMGIDIVQFENLVKPAFEGIKSSKKITELNTKMQDSISNKTVT